MLIESLEDFKNYSLNLGKPWFSVGSMRFFKTRLLHGTFRVSRGQAWFVTSESGPNGVRGYSIRVGNLETGNVHTLGEFQGYKTRAQAVKDLTHMANNRDDGGYGIKAM